MTSFFRVRAHTTDALRSQSYGFESDFTNQRAPVNGKLTSCRDLREGFGRPEAIVLWRKRHNQGRPMMDDELRLVRLMARHDRAAWSAMYKRHVGDVFGLVYYLLGGDQGTAEDICQEVWLLAIEQFNRFDPGRGRFREWILGIARHRVLRHHRRLKGLSPDDCPDEPSDSLGPHELLLQVEQSDVVHAALLCLDVDRRQVLLDKYISGLPVAEIAARTSRSTKAVESLLSRARAQLRVLLEPYFTTTTGGERHEPSDAQPA